MSTTNQISALAPITAPPIIVIDDRTAKIGEWTITVTPTLHPIEGAWDYNIEDENEELVNWYYGFEGNPGKPTDSLLSPVWSEALTVAREEWIERETNRLKAPPAPILVDADPGLTLIAQAITAQAATRTAEIDALCKTVADNLHDVLDCRDSRDAHPKNGNLPYVDALANLITVLIVAIDGDDDLISEIGEYLFS